jgi:hypothetical protein
MPISGCGCDHVVGRSVHLQAEPLDAHRNRVVRIGRKGELPILEDIHAIRRGADGPRCQVLVQHGPEEQITQCAPDLPPALGAYLKRAGRVI